MKLKKYRATYEITISGKKGLLVKNGDFIYTAKKEFNPSRTESECYLDFFRTEPKTTMSFLSGDVNLSMKILSHEKIEEPIC